MGDKAREGALLLEDMRNYARKARSFVAATTKDAVLDDERNQFAVFHCIKVIGEAAAHWKCFMTWNHKHILGAMLFDAHTGNRPCPRVSQRAILQTKSQRYYAINLSPCLLRQGNHYHEHRS